MLNANTPIRCGALTLAAALLLAVSSFFIPAAAAQAAQDRIAYDNDNQIVLMDADGGNKQVVNTPGFVAFDPSWSPDGKKLAFTCGGERLNVCVVAAAGGTPVELTETGTDYEPAWSPKGDKIAFTSLRDGDPRVYLMNADGSGEEPLQISDSSILATQHPAWSPDGTKIAFTGDTEGDSEIYSVVVGSGAVLRLTYHAERGAIQPAWSPDGKKIAFSDSRNIWVAVADGGGAEAAVTTSEEQDHNVPAWSLDGTRLSFFKSQTILDGEGGRLTIKGVYAADAGGGNLSNLLADAGNNPAYRPAVSQPAPPTPAERISNLIGVVRGFNLPFGTTNSLIVKLRAALDAIEAGDNAAACARLADFINHAGAQSGKKLSAAQAAQITTEAASIRAALGCQ